MKNMILIECFRRATGLNPNHPENKNGYHHFSFIVQKNQILGYGVNRSTGSNPTFDNNKIPKYDNFGFLNSNSISRTLITGYKPYQKLHSESVAYFKIRGLLNHRFKFEVVNIRLNKNSELKISRPCECCIRFLYGLGCSTVWFSTGLIEYKWAKLPLNEDALI